MSLNYVNFFFTWFSDLLNSLYSFADQIFSAVTPMGMMFVFGLIVMYVIIRYVIYPFLR